MSFVRLDNGEFPALNPLNQATKPPPKRTALANEFNSIELNNAQFVNHGEPSFGYGAEQITIAEDFFSCRVGYMLNDYREDLQAILDSKLLSHQSDFILAQIEPVRSASQRTDEFQALPDLVLSYENWQSRIALHICYPPVDDFSPKTTKQFDRIFRHALYLSPQVIVITCPDSELAHLTVAGIVNSRLGECKDTPLVLFKVHFCNYTGESEPWMIDDSSVEYQNLNNVSRKSNESQENAGESSHRNTSSSDNSSHEEIDLTADWIEESNKSFKETQRETMCPWKQWNSIRSHLNHENRVGVCLEINDELNGSEAELNRWMGEPVRMIIIHTDQLIKPTTPQALPRPTAQCKKFILMLAVANSLKTSFVIEGPSSSEIQDYLLYFNHLTGKLREQHLDHLLSWHDRLQIPLQPLSSNLDSATYGVFEMDSIKYLQYKAAMIEALKYLISVSEETKRKKFVLMVLGAGRGPLVDSFISAIKSVEPRYKFKIYALDKNPSSVRSLKYKQSTKWIDATGQYETEVIESDMRSWRPGVKADIIATELLGSLSDNELSPECVDGTWKLSTPKTISIPQQYTSHLAPICSYKLHQELHRRSQIEPHVFDQIYVVMLNNCYHIDKPQNLFEFEHKDLSLPQESRCNERYTKLTFWSRVDTVCHGFAGYFSAKLFGTVSLSTLIGNKTPNMDSWFPAFVPLDNPVQMPKGSKLVVHFWRKESSTSVWYEWALTSPEKSRIFSQSGVNTAMSKFV